jgi:hypothetical protein
MKRVLLLLILLAATVLIVSFLFAPPPTPPHSGEIMLTSLVQGCAETEEGMATRSLGEEIDREPTLTVQRDQITYTRAIHHLCCRKVEIRGEITGATIALSEHWSGPGCRCICFSEIEATLANLPSGSYNLTISEQGTEPGSEMPMETTVLLYQEVAISR